MHSRVFELYVAQVWNAPESAGIVFLACLFASLHCVLRFPVCCVLQISWQSQHFRNGSKNDTFRAPIALLLGLATSACFDVLDGALFCVARTVDITFCIPKEACAQWAVRVMCYHYQTLMSYRHGVLHPIGCSMHCSTGRGGISNLYSN